MDNVESLHLRAQIFRLIKKKRRYDEYEIIRQAGLARNLQSACTDMCRHIYNWNIVACSVKQPVSLSPTFYGYS